MDLQQLAGAQQHMNAEIRKINSRGIVSIRHEQVAVRFKMRMRSTFCRVCLISIKLLTVGVLIAEEPHLELPTTVQDALLNHNPRVTRFEVERAADELPDSPQIQIAKAVALLNDQPRTGGNVRKAQELLESVAVREDDAGLLAAYLQARIADVHFPDGDRDEALALYDSVIARKPGHLLAQIAMTKRVMLDVYFISQDPLQALAAASAWEKRFTEREAERDYHLVMGRSLLFFGGDDSEAFRHLDKALDLGLTDRLSRSGLTIAVAEIASRIGERDVARVRYQQFLDEYPRDQRGTLVREKLSNLLQSPQ